MAAHPASELLPSNLPKRSAPGSLRRRDRKKNVKPAVSIGADACINYKTEDFVAASKAATGGTGADVILDMVGGDYIERNYEAAAVDGRVVQIAVQSGAKATIDLRRIMLKRLTHTGSTLRARSVEDKAAIARAVEEQVLPLFVKGSVAPADRQHFSAHGGIRRPCAHGKRRTHRQDCTYACN